MLHDRYGFGLTSASSEARDAYVAGVDLALSANHGAEGEFRRAIACDAGLAVAYAALARTLQIEHKPEAAKAVVARARELASILPHRERSHVNALATVVDGGSVAGRADREAELLAFITPFADVYGQDWWFTSALAFAQVEVGEIERARATIERSLAHYPRNAHGAHIRAHVYYEAGEREAGLVYLQDWWRDYPKESLLHCHVTWHIALWQLALGRREEAWCLYRAHLRPGASTGPPINTLSDCASFLLRAEMAGEAREPELWAELSRYASQWFPSPGIAFADVHGALAHAFAGDADALARIVDRAKGPARDVVAPLARAFSAFSRSDWAAAAAEFEAIMSSHERIGGSRAQRDLIEYALVVCLLRVGRAEEARGLIAGRRRRSGADGWPIQGL